MKEFLEAVVDMMRLPSRPAAFCCSPRQRKPFLTWTDAYWDPCINETRGPARRPLPLDQQVTGPEYGKSALPRGGASLNHNHSALSVRTSTKNTGGVSGVQPGTSSSVKFSMSKSDHTKWPELG